MPAEGIVAFLRSPYGLVADVKMLDFFRHMGTTAAIVIGAARAGLGVRPERLVPLPLPLRRPAGPGGARQPDAHPPRTPRPASTARSAPRRARRPAGGPACQRPLGRVHELPAVHHGVPVRRTRSRCASVGRRTPSGPVVAAGVLVIFLAVVGVAQGDRPLGHTRSRRVAVPADPQRVPVRPPLTLPARGVRQGTGARPGPRGCSPQSPVARRTVRSALPCGGCRPPPTC